MNKLESEWPITHRKASGSEFQQEGLHAAFRKGAADIKNSANLTSRVEFVLPWCPLLWFALGYFNSCSIKKRVKPQSRISNLARLFGNVAKYPEINRYD